MTYELLFTGDKIKTRNTVTGVVSNHRLRALSYFNEIGLVFTEDYLHYAPHPPEYYSLILKNVVKTGVYDYDYKRKVSWFKVFDDGIDVHLYDDKTQVDIQEVKLVPLELKETEIKYYEKFSYEANILFPNGGNPIHVKRVKEDNIVIRYTEIGLNLYDLAKTFNKKLDRQLVTFDGLRMLDNLFPQNQWAEITPEAIDKYAKSC